MSDITYHAGMRTLQDRFDTRRLADRLDEHLGRAQFTEQDKAVLLKEIADRTGGQYFRAKDSEALSRIFHQIDQLEKTPVSVTRYTRFDEATRPFMLIGLLALGLELLLDATLVVRIP